jgi:hypothetical protein
MIKLILLVLIALGAFFALTILFGGKAFGTAFTAFNHTIPWIAVGVCVFGYIGYKAIK